MSELPIYVGVSACLLGEKVRYDGGHKHDHCLTEILSRFFSFVPVCPEVESGMPVPRESMRLEGDPARPRLIAQSTRRDLTLQMEKFSVRKVAELEKQDLCGFVFKKNSPSSGLWRVKVYNQGMPAKNGSGLFANAMTRHFPLLPVEEECRLHEPALRENFIERVFAYRRWKNFRKNDGTLGGLVTFHTNHKYELMAHNPMLYREMGRLVASGNGKELESLLANYEADFMHCLGYQATARKNADVLMHMMGYFKNELSPGEKAELLEVLADYRYGLAPLVVPLVLIRHYVRRFGQPYLREQTYLAPHPGELMQKIAIQKAPDARQSSPEE